MLRRGAPTSHVEVLYLSWDMNTLFSSHFILHTFFLFLHTFFLHGLSLSGVSVKVANIGYDIHFQNNYIGIVPLV